MSNFVDHSSAAELVSDSVFRLSALIRITLISLYIALTFPLPLLAEVVAAPVSSLFLWLVIAIGLILLQGALSEKVIVNNLGIQVVYPTWFTLIFPRGWSLNWAEIKELKMRTTGQGGLVYYFITQKRDRAYLLPMRIAGFARLVKIVEQKTGIDTREITPLSQPWMYFILLALTFFLLLTDAWIMFTVSQ